MLALWLPIVVSAVLIFFASFVLHMVLTYHWSDYRRLPDEKAVGAAPVSYTHLRAHETKTRIS